LTKYANLIIYTFFYKFAGRREKESIMKYIGKKLFLQMIIGFFAGQVGICGMCVLGVAYFAAVFEKAKARLLLAFCVIAGMFLGLPKWHCAAAWSYCRCSLYTIRWKDREYA